MCTVHHCSIARKERNKCRLVYVCFCVRTFGSGKRNSSVFNLQCGLYAFVIREMHAILPIAMHPGVLWGKKNIRKRHGKTKRNEGKAKQTNKQNCFVELNKTCYVLRIECQNNEMKNGRWKMVECNEQLSCAWVCLLKIFHSLGYFCIWIL